jgi:tetratricopeptide (TPR) repeat protein
MSAQTRERTSDAQERLDAIVRHFREGRPQEAERLCREVLDADPRQARGLHLLGVIAMGNGKCEQAVELMSTALDVAPDYAEARRDLGSALMDCGRLDEAIAAYNQALALQPNDPMGLYNLANALRASGLLADAVTAYERALALQPDYAKAWINLGNTLRRLGRLEAAAAAYEKAVKLQPERAEAYNNLGNVLRDLGRSGEALATYDLAAARGQPGFDSPLTNKALLLMELGRPQESLQAADQALAVNPRSAFAWHMRTQLKTFDPADIEAMEALAAAAGSQSSLDDQLHLRFALGKAWLDAGDADRAFAHLNEGNRLKRSTLSYDPEATGRWIARIAEVFTPQLMKKLTGADVGAGAADPSEAPVFIIGMPRSGTTLIEQILASHPDVHGAGELRVLPDLVDNTLSIADPKPDVPPARYPQVLSHLSPQDLKSLARNYLDRIRSLVPGRHQRVVDKMPLNFLYAGLIHLILPQAHIIHCRRNAVDTCLSCYTKSFTGELAFAYDLRELGMYYRHYDALMAHWRELLPRERFKEVHYENVVNDLEQEARDLLSFCGLDWNDACLAFHATNRQVRTASANQVRQPLYRTSVGRWKSCARHLQPLLAALET